jgi:hypothetical protein
MAETDRERPFWMDEDEWSKRYAPIPDKDLSANVVAGVPDLTEVKKGEVVGAYTRKDGLIIYHFYKRDRKLIYDQTIAEMDEIAAAYDEKLKDPNANRAAVTAERDVKQAEVAAEANAFFEEHPWWDEIEQILRKVFTDHFKYQPHKITYYREVDSWSVILPEPNTPVKWGPAQLEVPFAQVALQVEG